MSAERFAWTVVCEDVRTEVGQKYSFIGVIQSEIVVPVFPTTLPKLFFVMHARTPASQPFEKIVFKVLKNDSEVLAEADVDVSTIGVSGTTRDDADPVFVANVICAFSPMVLKEPCKLSARVYTEAEEMRAGSVWVVLGG